MKTPQMIPNGSVEVVWLLISLLCVDAERQVAILNGVPRKGEKDAEIPSRNSASLLLTALQTFYVSWLDAFEPRCEKAKRLFELAWSMGVNQTLEEFTTGEDWAELRALAREALREVDLEPWPLPPKICFEDFMEIVHPEDL